MCDDLANSLFLPDSMQVHSWQMQGDVLTVVVQGRSTQFCCPLCQFPTACVHGRYRRHPEELPCSGRRVRLVIEVRRFQCRNMACRRRTFAETAPIFPPMQRRIYSVSNRIVKNTSHAHDTVPIRTRLPLAASGCRLIWLFKKCVFSSKTSFFFFKGNSIMKSAYFSG